MIKNLHFTRSLTIAALAIFMILPGLGWATGLTFYSQGNLAPDALSSWNTVRGGGGTVPANFINNDIFVIQTGHIMTTTAIWDVNGGSLAKIQIENGGTLIATYAITINAVGTFQIDDGGTYKHQNTDTYSSTILQGTELFAPSSNFEINNSSTTGPSGGTIFGNLIINCTLGTSVNLNSAISTINGNLVIQNTSTGEFLLGANTSYSINIGGDLIISGGILNTSNGSTASLAYVINLAGNYNQAGGTFIHGNSSSLLTFNFAGTGKSFTNTGTLTSSYINWAVNSEKTLSLASNLPVASGRTLTVNGTLDCGATYAVSGNGSVNIANGGILKVGSLSGSGAIGANITVSGGLTLSTGSTVEFNGALAQTIAARTFDGLKINNSAGVTLTGNVTVNGALTLTNGVLSTGAHTATISSSGSISGADATHYVSGNLNRYVGTNSSAITWPIGDGSNYTPVTLIFTSPTGTGSVTVKQTAGNHPNNSNSQISSTKRVDRYYTLTNSGVGNLDYSATFNFAAGDILGSATTDNFIVGKYSTGWTYPTVGTKTATSTQITGVTTMSDFQIGENGCTVTSGASNDGPICEGTTLTFTGSAANGSGSYTYGWTGPNSFSSPLQNPTISTVTTDANGTYILTVTDTYNGCTSIANSIAVVNALPTATITGNATICKGTSTDISVALTGTQPWSITYYDGLNSFYVSGIKTSPRIISVTPASTTTYTITAVSYANCTGTLFTGSALITVNALPSVPTVGTITKPTCAVPTGSVALSDLPASGSWTVTENIGLTFIKGSGTAADFTGLADNTTYKFTVTNSDGCTSVQSVDAIIDAAPAISIAPTGDAVQNFCSAATVADLVSVGATINWYNAASGGTLLSSGNALSDGVHYYASQTETGKCESTSLLDVTVTFILTPTADAGPANDLALLNTPYTFPTAVASGGTISWTLTSYHGLGAYTFTGSGNAHPVFTPAASGDATFELKVKGCSTTITDVITVFVMGTDPITWDGSTNSDWHTTTNWTPEVIPNATTNISIPVVASKYPVIGGAAACKNITIASGASIMGNELLTVNGTAKVEVSLTGGVYHSYSPSVTGAKAGDVFYNPANSVYIYSHSEVNNADAYAGYAAVTGSNILQPMSGYSVKASATGTFSQTGTLNKGNYSRSDLTRTGSGTYSGFNYVGNPYPSYIDWTSGSMAKTNLAVAIYTENAGTWATYNSPGPSTNGGSNIVAPGQGFFVSVTSGTGTLSMTPAVRTNTTTSYLKSASATDYVRLVATGNNKSDETVVRFESAATPQYDSQYDALKMEAGDPDFPQIYSVSDKKLSYNALPETGEVQLGFAAKTGAYTISQNAISGLSMVTLEDTKTGIFTVLDNSIYAFDFTSGENENRFILHFGALAVKEAKKATVAVYSYQQTVHINMKDQEKGDIYIYNIAGQLVASKLSAQGANEIKLPNVGNYIVKVITRNNTQVRKVFIQ